MIITTALHSLQGALGKTSGRSYKAAPRQLLQVDSNNAGTSPTLSHAHAHISKVDAIHADSEGAAKEAAKLGREALGDAAPVSIKYTRVILVLIFSCFRRLAWSGRNRYPIVKFL